MLTEYANVLEFETLGSNNYSEGYLVNRKTKLAIAALATALAAILGMAAPADAGVVQHNRPTVCC